jgi:hypothetical protein
MDLQAKRVKLIQSAWTSRLSLPSGPLFVKTSSYVMRHFIDASVLDLTNKEPSASVPFVHI